MERCLFKRVGPERVGVLPYIIKSHIYAVRHLKEYANHAQYQARHIPMTIWQANAEGKGVTLPMVQLDFSERDVDRLYDHNTYEAYTHHTKELVRIKPFITVLWCTKEQAFLMSVLSDDTPLLDGSCVIRPIVNEHGILNYTRTPHDDIRYKEMIEASLENITIKNITHKIVI